MSQNPKVDYLKGNFYEKIGKSELAVEKFREAAESGYERAQLILGQLYDSQGEIEKAENWYRSAFNNGVDYAAFNLGNMYYNNEIYDTSQYCFWQQVFLFLLPFHTNKGMYHRFHYYSTCFQG